ncbi:MAG: ABC transporter permease [Dysgonamonadaceae bacterium]|jgi:ABC-2 type transport system permease protein|nr:ABC transporter permease [Dysgonamonadaceae bacterium]
MKELIDKGLRSAFHIWKEELKRVFRDPGVIIFFLVVPFAYPVLYALIYNRETAREVPMVVVDRSATPLSREFIRKIDATPDVKILARCTGLEEAKAVVDAKQAYGTLFIPPSFAHDIRTGKQTSVSLFCDMGALLYYKALLLATTEVSLEMRKETGTTTPAILYESVALYNTQNGFSSFLVPAILILVIQQTLLLGIGMLAGTARERKPSGGILPVDGNSYGGALRCVLGKSLAYLVIYILVCGWALMLVPFLFHLPRMGNGTTLLLFTLPFMLACIFFSMTVSCLVTGREIPMLLFVFMSVVLLFMSGISWPLSAVPDAWRWISYLFPSTFGIQGFVKINSMGASLTAIDFEYRALWLQTGGYFVSSCLLHARQRIRRTYVS